MCVYICIFYFDVYAYDAGEMFWYHIYIYIYIYTHTHTCIFYFDVYAYDAGEMFWYQILWETSGGTVPCRMARVTLPRMETWSRVAWPE